MFMPQTFACVKNEKPALHRVATSLEYQIPELLILNADSFMML